MKVPGPGHYRNDMLQMSPKGDYYISSLKNSFCRQFTKEARHGIMDSIKEKCKN